jgi:hypothetical protein
LELRRKIYLAVKEKTELSKYLPIIHLIQSAIRKLTPEKPIEVTLWSIVDRAQLKYYADTNTNTTLREWQFIGYQRFTRNRGFAGQCVRKITGDGGLLNLCTSSAVCISEYSYNPQMDEIVVPLFTQVHYLNSEALRGYTIAYTKEFKVINTSEEKVGTGINLQKSQVLERDILLEPRSPELISKLQTTPEIDYLSSSKSVRDEDDDHPIPSQKPTDEGHQNQINTTANKPSPILPKKKPHRKGSGDKRRRTSETSGQEAEKKNTRQIK